MSQQQPHSAEELLAPPTSVRDIFPPVSKAHILNCAYPNWHARYRSLTPKSRILPIPDAFLRYLNEDGIILPWDDDNKSGEEDDDDDDDDDDEEDVNPAHRFPDFHQKVKDTIRELGGKVYPKLNWSAPRDATFMTSDNTLECRTPSDIYLLLKSSDYITHDLEHAFDDCVDVADADAGSGYDGEVLRKADIPYSLVLRKWFQLNLSMEFRCFVRGRRLLAACQREPTYYAFLASMARQLVHYISEFFEENLKHTFPDHAFVFDVYIAMSASGRKTWLIDINPFAPRTDPLLYSWVELLELPFEGDEAENTLIELRLVRCSDPEAYSFYSAQHSTSKLPLEVAEAGLEGDDAVWEFAARWREIVKKMEDGEE